MGEKMLVGIVMPSNTIRLLAEMRESIAQWGARDLNQPLERLVQLQDQEDRNCD